MSGALMSPICAVFAPFAEKRLARHADASPKTAGRWKRGEATPSGEALLALMANDDEVFLAVLRHIGREPDTSAARQHLERALAALEGRA
jgi:hypothetical protein